MANLIYSAISSLGGYIEDEKGRFDWDLPDEEVPTFIKELERPIGTHLFGRRIYEVMTAREGLSNDAGPPAVEHDFATTSDAVDKFVYFRTFETASSAGSRIERNFATDEVRRMKNEAGRDLTVGGSGIAAAAIRAGLVDECQPFLSPIVLGGGLSILADGIRAGLELLDERRFGNGVAYLRYGRGKE